MRSLRPDPGTPSIAFESARARRRGRLSERLPLACVHATLVAAAVLLPACSDKPVQFAPLAAQSVVLVIGDSLVAGTGASAGQAWPGELARATGWRVVNVGVPGDTSADALARLGALLRTHEPAAVVIAVGGNDFLRKVPLDATRAKGPDKGARLGLSTQRLLGRERRQPPVSPAAGQISRRPGK
jgi:hypothetical protein